MCEQVFLTMKINKNKTRSRITNAHFRAVLRVNFSKSKPIEHKMSSVNVTKVNVIIKLISLVILKKN